GSCMLLRTKKCGTGVIQESKNSGGISRSRKRAERTIKPSLPGTSTASSAQESSRRDAVVRATDAETALRKLRLEIILFSHEPLNLNSAKLEQLHGFLQDMDVGVGVLPEAKEVLVG